MTAGTLEAGNVHPSEVPRCTLAGFLRRLEDDQRGSGDRPGLPGGSIRNGARLVTYAMSRRYGFDHMSVDDHRALFDTSRGAVGGGTGRRVAHGRDQQCEPCRVARLAAVQQQAGRPPGGALRSAGRDGGNGGPDVGAGPFPAQRLHAVPRRDPQSVGRLPDRKVRRAGAAGAGDAAGERIAGAVPYGGVRSRRASTTR